MALGLATKPLGRRRALALMAGALAPVSTLAQTTPAPTQPPQPAPQPAPAAPPILSARPAEPIDRSKYYILFFQQQIDANSVKGLRNMIVALAEDGMAEATLSISSGGGLVAPTILLYNLIRALPMKLNTHGQTFVQSAATVLFLAGSARSADANTKFYFHPTSALSFAAGNKEQAQEQLGLLDDFDAAMAAIYRERTQMPDEDIKEIHHSLKIYDAAKALSYKIIDQVGPLKIPTEKRVKLVFFD